MVKKKMALKIGIGLNLLDGESNENSHSLYVRTSRQYGEVD